MHRPRVSVIAGLVLLLVLAVPVSAQVNRAESLDEYLSERLSSADLDQMQREVFRRVAEMRAVTEPQVVAGLGGMAGGLESGPDPGILTTRLPLGMDSTFLNASEGDNGGSNGECPTSRPRTISSTTAISLGAGPPGPGRQADGLGSVAGSSSRVRDPGRRRFPCRVTMPHSFRLSGNPPIRSWS